MHSIDFINDNGMLYDRLNFCTATECGFVLVHLEQILGNFSKC